MSSTTARPVNSLAESIREDGFATIEEAQERASSLVRDIQDIDRQLGEKSRPGPDGFPMPLAEFNEWRRHAIRAKDVKVYKLRLIKGWIRTQQTIINGGPAAAELGPDPTTAQWLLAAIRMLRRRESWDLLAQEDRHAVDAMELHLRKVGLGTPGR